VAVEVHQGVLNSSDLSLKLDLVASTGVAVRPGAGASVFLPLVIRNSFLMDAASTTPAF
jgi:hypothetical protein